MTEKTFSLTLTEQMLNVVGAGLAELAYKVSAPVLADIQRQITSVPKAAPTPSETVQEVPAEPAPQAP